MFSIDVDCKDHNANDLPAAPLLGGELQVGDESFPIVFLIDTGADSPLIDTATLPRVPQALGGAPQQMSRGIGGAWPIFAPDAEMSLAVMATEKGAEEQHGVNIPLVEAQFLAPYARQRPGGPLEGLLRRPRQETVNRTKRQVNYHQAPPAFHLLGRNVFVENHLKLVFDPHGESQVLTRPESGLVEVLQKTPRKTPVTEE